MNLYAEPYTQIRVSTDGLYIDDSMQTWGVKIYDRVLRKITVIQREELYLNPDMLNYAREKHISERRRIIHLIDVLFLNTGYWWRRPHYMLLGSQLGPLVISIAKQISDIECHIYDWPDDYDKSADYVYRNPKATYNQYKMHGEVCGWESIYAEEEFVPVKELFGLMGEALHSWT